MSGIRSYSSTTRNLRPRRGGRFVKTQTALSSDVSPVSHACSQMVDRPGRPTCSYTHHGQETRAAIYKAFGGVESEQQLSQIFREQENILRQAEINNLSRLKKKRRRRARTTNPWACISCTFVNEPGKSVCGICSTPYGDKITPLADQHAAGNNAGDTGVPFCRATALLRATAPRNVAQTFHVVMSPEPFMSPCRPYLPCRLYERKKKCCGTSNRSSSNYNRRRRAWRRQC